MLRLLGIVLLFSSFAFSATYHGQRGPLMAPSANGKVWLVDQVWYYTGNFAVARLNADGKIDAGFGKNGVVPLPFDTAAEGRPVSAIAAHGSGLVMVYHLPDARSFYGNLTLTRLDEKGAVDIRFGQRGFVHLDDILLGYVVPQGLSKAIEVQSIHVLPAGDILLNVNIRTANPTGYEWRTALWHFDSKGEFDDHFAGSGMAVAYTGNCAQMASFLGVDGFIYAVASGCQIASSRVTSLEAVARRFDLQTGQWDTSYGGELVTLRDHTATDEELAVSMNAATPTAEGITALFTGNGVQLPALAKIDTKGHFDLSFAQEGLYYIALPPGGNRDFYTERVSWGGDSTYLSLRTVDNHTGNSMPALLKLTESGVPDATFGKDGLLVLASQNGEFDHIFAAPTGTCTAAYHHYPWGSEVMSPIATRVLPDGKPDSTFGTNGSTSIPME